MYRLQELQHSAHKRTGAWTRREQTVLKSYLAAGAKNTMIAERLRTRTPKQVEGYIQRNNLSVSTPWSTKEDERLRNTVATASATT